MKTRLAKDLGDEEAARVYSEIARDIISRVAAAPNYQTAVFYDPPEKKDEVASWLGDIAQNGADFLFQQEGEILGDRISNAFKRVFSSGAERAVIIGTDCVGVTAEMIRETFSELTEYDAVIGPAEDGGYYLLGLSRFIPELFLDIEWSTERVFEQTLERVTSLGLKYELLETLSDVDNINDLQRLPKDLNL